MSFQATPGSKLFGGGGGAGGGAVWGDGVGGGGGGGWRGSLRHDQLAGHFPVDPKRRLFGAGKLAILIPPVGGDAEFVGQTVQVRFLVEKSQEQPKGNGVGQKVSVVRFG